MLKEQKLATSVSVTSTSTTPTTSSTTTSSAPTVRSTVMDKKKLAFTEGYMTHQFNEKFKKAKTAVSLYALLNEV